MKNYTAIMEKLNSSEKELEEKEKLYNSLDQRAICDYPGLYEKIIGLKQTIATLRWVLHY